MQKAHNVNDAHTPALIVLHAERKVVNGRKTKPASVNLRALKGLPSEFGETDYLKNTKLWPRWQWLQAPEKKKGRETTFDGCSRPFYRDLRKTTGKTTVLKADLVYNGH